MQLFLISQLNLLTKIFEKHVDMSNIFDFIFKIGQRQIIVLRQVDTWV